MGDRESARRVLGACVLMIGLVSCAETPPQQQKPAVTAPLTTPVPAGVPKGPAIQFLAPAAARPYLLATVTISLDRSAARERHEAGGTGDAAADGRRRAARHAPVASRPSPRGFREHGFRQSERRRVRGAGRQGEERGRARGPGPRAGGGAEDHRRARQEDHDARSGDAGRGQHGRPRLALQVGQHRGAQRRRRRPGARDDADAGGAPRRPPRTSPRFCSPSRSRARTAPT